MAVLASTPGSPPSPEGSYPRPQLVRPAWADLCGTWDFAFDDDSRGVEQGCAAAEVVFDSKIVVPFPPESAASGLADPGFHPVVWYRRQLGRTDLEAAGLGGQGDRVLLHFGAVDYAADVWLAGHHLGHHEGGHTPFTFDVTQVLSQDVADWSLVVRAVDDPHDLAQPRGKQDWQSEPHGIWYPRTTGIWQPVWLEAVPAGAVTALGWSCDLPAGAVELTLELADRPRVPATVSVRIDFAGEQLAELTFTQWEPRSSTVISLPHQTNGQAYESLLWAPEHPRLLSAQVQVSYPGGSTDAVSSYFGLRSVGWADGHFMLNDRPYYVRAVLAQGYWPQTHLAAPDAKALRDEVVLIRNLGFNSVRLHQKVEDPRFLYWADALGLMVWEETPSAYEFSPTAVQRMTREWTEVIRRDSSHPSIVVWVPLNESWGVQHISHDRRQLDYAQALYHLTKSLDPSRPVVTNDGWEHADSDIWTVHDYAATGAELHANYADQRTLHELLAGIGPLGRRMRLLPVADRGQPVIVSEFGGISYAPTHPGSSWGYVTTALAPQFSALLRELFEALQSSPVLAGFCYTQLTDVHQEANGLATADRTPKLDVDLIRAIVLGDAVDTSSHRRPKKPVEQLNALRDPLSEP